jgi:acyl CoA:acetate/3-ketoacid CoA transferase alpha subunit
MVPTIPANEISRSQAIDDREPALKLNTADLALLQALTADSLDNLVYRGSSRNLCAVMTLAAKDGLQTVPKLTLTQPC